MNLPQKLVWSCYVLALLGTGFVMVVSVGDGDGRGLAFGAIVLAVLTAICFVLHALFRPAR